jgi:hypothetical protein
MKKDEEARKKKKDKEDSVDEREELCSPRLSIKWPLGARLL